MSETAGWLLALDTATTSVVVAAGTPEQVAQIETSHTGRYLRSALAEGRSHAYASGR